MKKTIFENYRVTVIPTEGVWLQFRKKPREDRIIDCERVIEQIKRHVDDVDSVEWECDKKEVCEFCEMKWEEDEEGCPVCCEAAVKEWESNNPTGDECPDECAHGGPDNCHGCMD